MPQDPQPDDWAERRSDAAHALADRMARRRSAETARARELVAGFVTEARRRGLREQPLLAKAGDGPPTYRTGMVGWYLNREGSIGVTPDGEYYDLVHPASLKARLRGVTLRPADPPIQVGAGARDGESIALEALISLRLQAGDTWGVPGR